MANLLDPFGVTIHTIPSLVAICNNCEEYIYMTFITSGVNFEYLQKQISKAQLSHVCKDKKVPS